jgi:hypothetical protein
MGINGAHNLTYAVTKINLQQLFTIGVYLYNKYNVSVLKRTPTIYIDASWIIRKCHVECREGYLVRLCTVLAETGFQVTVVCDGPIQHHSKRSTTKRVAETYSSRIKLNRNNTFLMSLLDQKNKTDSREEATRIEESMRVISAKISTLQSIVKKGKIEVGNVSFNKITELINNLNNKNINVIQAKFQADSVLAASLLNHKSDIGFSADSDLAALLGERCISVQKFTFNDRHKKKTLKDLKLFGADLITIQNIVDHLSLPAANIVMAKRPIFEGIEQMNVQCLLAIGVGCDVFIPGVSGITARILSDFLGKLRQDNVNQEDYYNIIMNKYMSSYSNHQRGTGVNIMNAQLDKDMYKIMLQTYVETLLYKPTNYITLDHNNEDYGVNSTTYINDNYTPTELHPYIKDFGRGEPNIIINQPVDECIDLMQCVGPGKGSHLFMQKEGYFNCRECNLLICKTCTLIDEDQYFCVNCFASTQFVDVDLIEQDNSPDDMVEKITERGYQVSVNDPIEEIIDVYDTIINKNQGIFNESILDSISVPEKPSNYLQSIDYIGLIRLSKGGSFINDCKLHLDDIVDVLKIFCQLINIDTKHSCSTDVVARTFNVLPTIIIDLARRARIISAGYRLLKRCVRHAMDTAAADVRESKIFIIKVDNDTIGLVMKHKVRASMRNELYDVTVCFKEKTIMSCDCTCKCGSQNNESILCIHILPCLFQITLEIYDGLAEHLLVELASYISLLNEPDFSDTNIIDLQQIITLLLFCVHKNTTVINCDEVGIRWIKGMLSNYSSEQTKARKCLLCQKTDHS